MNCLDPDLLLPFFGYRLLDEVGRHQEMVPSLTHFFESEKLRGRNEELRRQILSATSARAARKISRKNRDQWRADWQRVRARVLATGMAMQMMQSRSAVQMIKRTAELHEALKADKSRMGGLPVSFITGVAAQLVKSAASRGVARVGVVALRRHTPEDLPDRLDALFTAGLPLAATIYAGNDASLPAERWCIQNSVAVRLLGVGMLRFRADEVGDLLKRSSTVVLCAPAGRTEVARFIAQAQQTRRQLVTLTRASPDFDDDDLPAQ